MEREAVQLEAHELASLAGQHGTTEEEIRQLVAESGSRSQREIEEALELARGVLRSYRAF